MTTTIAETEPRLTMEVHTISGFAERLTEQVRAEMGRLIEAGALDEWHVPVLDELITQQVEIEQARIHMWANSQRTLWHVEQATAGRDHQEATRERSTAEVAMAEADERIRSAQEALAAHRAQPTPIVAELPPAGRLQRLRDWRRPALAASLSRRVERQHEVVAAAVAAHAQAQLHFHGVQPQIESYAQYSGELA